MPEDVQVTLTVQDDGSVDIAKFKDDPHLSKIKGVIDGLRKESAGYRTKVSELEPQVGRITELEAQVAQWENKVAMTPEEKQQYDEAVKKLENYKDLDPEAARAALSFKQQFERDQALGKAFKAAGFDPEAALELNGVRELETRLVDADGKQVAQVKQGDEWKPLDAFVSQRYERFLDILKPSKRDVGGGSRPPGDGDGTPKGINDLKGKSPQWIKDHWASITSK